MKTGISKAFKRLDYEGKENGVECRSSFFFFFFFKEEQKQLVFLNRKFPSFTQLFRNVIYFF